MKTDDLGVPLFWETTIDVHRPELLGIFDLTWLFFGGPHIVNWRILIAHPS